MWLWDRALAKIELVHFSLKILHLVTRFLTIFFFTTTQVFILDCTFCFPDWTELFGLRGYNVPWLPLLP